MTAPRSRPRARALAALLALGTLTLAALAPACAEPTPRDTSPPRPALPEVAANALRPVAAFTAIADARERSVALFVEASRVLQHPRCSNCHPSDDRPRQRTFEAHVPPVVRGSDDRGVAVLECASCHTARNAELARVPGAPGWHLAPRSMAWLGVPFFEICEQLKDRAKNGGRTLDAIVEHGAHDALVAWAWAPGADREPAPGTQADFGALLRAWVDTGAHCPPGPER